MKRFFTKIKNWFKKHIHMPTKRRLIQLYTALLYNANIKGFFTGNISKSNSKNVCIPGFNCYSCPGAVGACPLGSLQNALGSSKTNMIAYVVGIIALFGLILGRTICGFLCPMGFLQDLTYKIKSPKLKKNKVTKILSYFKYVVLIVFVVALPLVYASGDAPLPAFCQYICPVGTLAGLAFLTGNTNQLASLGVLFTWKFIVAVLIIIGSIFIFRIFCRFFCPLGALYSLFSKIALLGIKLDKQKCIDCGLCIKTCKVDINHVGDHECIQCGDCVSVCPTNAISWKGGKVFVLPNQTEQPEIKEVDFVGLAEQKQSSVDYENIVTTQIIENKHSVKRTEKTVQSQKKELKSPFYALKKNNGKGFKIIAFSLAIFVLIYALVYFNFIEKDTTASSNYTVGDTMTDFEMKEFFSSDEKYVFSEDNGKIVVLNFWYIGCGGCEAEMPHFGALASNAEYRDKVSVVVVHSNDDIIGAEDPDTFNGQPVKYVEKYILENKSQSQITTNNWNTFYQNIKWVIDADGEESLYLSLGGVGAWPMTAIVDGNGIIRFITASSVTEEILYQEINKILAEN